MTVTQIVSSMTFTICLLIDGIVIGRLLGIGAMSAYGLANPVIIIFNSIGIMISCGVQILIGKALGTGDADGCRQVFSTSVIMSLVIAAVWMLVVFSASKPLCTILGAGNATVDKTIFTMTEDYLRGYMLGAPFCFLSQITIPYMQSMGKRKLTLLSAAVLAGTDILFDFLAVFVFHTGMFGIGLASGISFLAATLVSLVFFVRRDCPFRFSRGTVRLRTAGAIVNGGSPSIINQFFFMIRMYAVNQILLVISGTVAVAVFSVFCTVGTVVFSICLGIGAIVLTLTSVFYSEEDRTSILELIREMIPYSLKIITIMVVLTVLAAPLLISLFLGGDPAVHAIAVPGLRLYCLSYIPCVITADFRNYYQGIRKIGFTNLISFFENTGLLIPITWIFGKLMGLSGVWIGTVVAQAAVVLLILFIVWIKTGKAPCSAETVSLLGQDFGADEKDTIEMSVQDLDSAVKASKQVYDFCNEKGLRSRTSLIAGLCVEEIAVNIIEHGFTKDNRSHNADVKMVVKGDRCILRVRDNCINFDPTKYLEMHQSNDPAAHIGLKMVMGLAKDIDYNNSLGLNNLYMRFSV